jgi:hypothetical protein
MTARSFALPTIISKRRLDAVGGRNSRFRKLIYYLIINVEESNV